MYENARKALIGAVTNYCCHTGSPRNDDVGCYDCAKIVNEAFEALRPHLIPDGCVASCKRCEQLYSEAALCRDTKCPLKPKELK
jgi:hypothetical protein